MASKQLVPAGAPGSGELADEVDGVGIIAQALEAGAKIVADYEAAGASELVVLGDRW